MSLPRRGLLAASAVIGGLFASTAPAVASDPPRCWNPSVWARPDIARTFELYCPRAERIELVSAPTASRFEGLVRGESFKFRLTPEAGAPEHDTLTVRLTGAGGSREQDIEITNVPLERNTAPRCQPASVAQRTAGTEPVTLFFMVQCDDDEHDGFTLHGGGPGTHSDPATYEGGLGGASNHGWNYRPTIASGQEQTTYHAIDDLGTRSPDAPISVQVGPAVDRLPQCTPSATAWGFDFLATLTRPGATRRFGVICEDADGDPFLTRIKTPPSRGDLTLGGPGGTTQSPSGHSLWLDATYVPETTFEGEDRFSIVAAGGRGEGPAVAMGMVSMALPYNSGGGGCGWSGAQTLPGDPVTLEVGCFDDEGDRLGANVTVAPEHGDAAEPRIVAGSYGQQRVLIAYRPQAGFAGVDRLTVDIGDGNGMTMAITVDIFVRSTQTTQPPSYTIGSPYDWPELHPRGPTWQPSVGQAPPRTPVDQARRALGTRSVRLVKRIGDGRVYAARGALPAASRRSALAVTCPVRCAVSSTSSVAGRSAGAAKLRVKPGKAGSLGLALTPAQRKNVRRAGRARASFRLTVARTGRPARRATVRLPLRG